MSGWAGCACTATSRARSSRHAGRAAGIPGDAAAPVAPPHGGHGARRAAALPVRAAAWCSLGRLCTACARTAARGPRAPILLAAARTRDRQRTDAAADASAAHPWRYHGATAGPRPARSDTPNGVDIAPDHRWCLYLLECGDGSWYAGISNDL